MVMVTRSRRKTLDSYSSSDMSQKSNMPPWCSSAKHGRKHRPRSPSWHVKSTCDLRVNIWEYLHENDKTKIINKKVRKNKAKKGLKLKLLLLMFIVGGMLASLWICKSLSRQDLLTKLLPYTSLISLSLNNMEYTAVSEECCSRMQYLAEALSRAEQALRTAQRMKKSLLLSSNSYAEKSADTADARGYIQAHDARVGAQTAAWGGRAALWGVLPLWSAARPPATVLSSRRAAPADCWPFRGSSGELVIELPQRENLNCMSIEHVKPDTARSSPKNFALFGILENGTWVKAIEDEYRYHGAAKQYFPVRHMQVPVKRLVLQIYSNQGNSKYTCVYRVHFFRKISKELKLK